MHGLKLHISKQSLGLEPLVWFYKGADQMRGHYFGTNNDVEHAAGMVICEEEYVFVDIFL